MQLEHTLSDGRQLMLHLKRSAKKNIILRPMHGSRISINIPPHLSERRLRHWLNSNESVLDEMLQRSPPETPSETLPAHIWYRGRLLPLRNHAQSAVCISDDAVLLPEHQPEQHKQLLLQHLQQQAHSLLLPRLQAHSRALQLIPAATALSNAKTFWGVCRSRTGIRLNWRLIGAPDFVIDYVCIHELCHLRHPDHSPNFWAAVNRHTPHTAAAKQWLKQHGAALFALD